VPWQRDSSDDLHSSRVSVVQDGAGKRPPQTGASNHATTNDGKDDGQNNSEKKQPKQGSDQSSASGKSPAAGDGSSKETGGENAGSAVDKSGKSAGRDRKGAADDTEKSDAGQSAAQARDSGQSESQSDSKQADESTAEKSEQAKAEEKKQTKSDQAPPGSHTEQAKETLQKLSSAASEIGGLFKLLFYGALALLACFLAWTYRHQILQALADIVNQLRALFGGKSARAALVDPNANSITAPPATFQDFRDPFSTGQHSRMSPEELVRYTFAAFEAWASDRGRMRTPDCTPSELVLLAVDPESPMYEEARHLVRLYGEMAYAARSIPRESAGELATMWQMMQSAQSLSLAIADK
jgi:hypothetical protein